jgi:hypothetical protein
LDWLQKVLNPIHPLDANAHTVRSVPKALDSKKLRHKRPFPAAAISLERDDERHPVPVCCLSMILSEKRYPLFGIML